MVSQSLLSCYVDIGPIAPWYCCHGQSRTGAQSRSVKIRLPIWAAITADSTMNDGLNLGLFAWALAMVLCFGLGPVYPARQTAKYDAEGREDASACMLVKRGVAFESTNLWSWMYDEPIHFLFEQCDVLILPISRGSSGIVALASIRAPCLEEGSCRRVAPDVGTRTRAWPRMRKATLFEASFRSLVLRPRHIVR